MIWRWVAVRCELREALFTTDDAGLALVRWWWVMCENLNTEVNTWTVEDANAMVFIVIYARQGLSNVLVNLCLWFISPPRRLCPKNWISICVNWPENDPNISSGQSTRTGSVCNSINSQRYGIWDNFPMSSPDDGRDLTCVGGLMQSYSDGCDVVDGMTDAWWNTLNNTYWTRKWAFAGGCCSRWKKAVKHNTESTMYAVPETCNYGQHFSLSLTDHKHLSCHQDQRSPRMSFTHTQYEISGFVFGTKQSTFLLLLLLLDSSNRKTTTNDYSFRGLVQSITSNSSSSSWGDGVPSNRLSVTARLEETNTDCHRTFIVSRGSGFVLSLVAEELTHARIYS